MPSESELWFIGRQKTNSVCPLPIRCKPHNTPILIAKLPALRQDTPQLKPETTVAYWLLSPGQYMLFGISSVAMKARAKKTVGVVVLALICYVVTYLLSVTTTYVQIKAVHLAVPVYRPCNASIVHTIFAPAQLLTLHTCVHLAGRKGPENDRHTAESGRRE
ncbi:MAG: hypothetical protein H7A46_16795 [Verrucomicrobiales bacterium]|nr:hypothetical protein [Verrucomicrobiales bacterium]